MNTSSHTPGQYCRTVRHLRGAQLWWRARYALRRRFGAPPRLPTTPDTLEVDTAALEGLRGYARLAQAYTPPSPARLVARREGTFTFLNETEHTPKGPPWNAAVHRSRLWQYHLHYFDYARELAIDNVDITWDDDRALVRAWIRSWFREHAAGADIAWDAFTTSSRLINWCITEAVFDLEDQQILDSMYQQTEWLLRHIEYDIAANHLLKNAVALVVAGTVLASPAAKTGLGLLKGEVREQILDDGGHYERSPMYHALVLDDLIVAHAVLAEKPAWLTDAIARMAGWLDAVCHPDGDIPLFCDAALNASPPPKPLVHLAEQVIALPPEQQTERAGGSFALEDSGYYVLTPQDARGWMIVKTASPAPDYQPGHTHCDLFSYEFSAMGRRMIVDTGTHGYAGSDLRDYCRGTAAHNTVQVGDGEQHECWSTFRVGRRARVTRCDWTGETLELEHDGFAPGKHRRTITFDGEHTWRVNDTVPGAKEDWRSFVHLHPDVMVTPREEGHGYRIQCADACMLLIPDGETQSVHQPASDATPYCPEFGIATPAPVFVLTPRDREGTVAYAIVAGETTA